MASPFTFEDWLDGFGGARLWGLVLRRDNLDHLKKAPLFGLLRRLNLQEMLVQALVQLLHELLCSLVISHTEVAVWRGLRVRPIQLLH
mmetsp:Transcript_18442/g.17565  ORF Transcript_18442/g.17565 Transcript_18442/m.17565 type:complete len:88 (-) Transcript_18442:1893-2156(-)